MMLRRRARQGAALCAVVTLAGLGLGLGGPAVSRSAADPLSPAIATAVTVHKTVQRTFTDDGATKVVDKRAITLKVGQTTGLKSLQLIKVSWSGARPTAGLVPDRNSDLAMNEEYPFALFECRGVDSAKHPLSPNTCWTQYADERFDYGYDDSPYPAWRSDVDASPRQRRAIVDAPKKLNSQCHNGLYGSTYQRWVPFDGVGNRVYHGGLFGCAGVPAEAAAQNLSSNVSLPSNETFGVTDARGNGSALFDIFTGEDHASLGCSQTVPCSLVAVPIEGVSCDPQGSKLPATQRPDDDDAAVAQANCESSGVYGAGQPYTVGRSGDKAVDGQLWWSPSNWKNRLSVPLSFAPADNVCSLQSSATPTSVYGSELLAQATTQWAPAFCLNPKLFDLNHVQTPEPQARSLLATGNVDAIYTSDPPSTPYPLPTVNAPVAVTGFGVAFDVDDGNGAPIRHLNLDARLLAKLLTESYPATTFVRNEDTALANNPLSITNDPEFIALNPDVPQLSSEEASTLLTLNTDSDLVTALTSYINADPEARTWLNGTPDPWGMVVNPAYKKIKLPVDNWPLLDTFVPAKYVAAGVNPCYSADPTPYAALIAAPQARLFTIGQDLQFAIAQNQTTCVLPSPIIGDTAGAKLVASGRQAAGRRFMLGTVSLGDAAREGLALASLKTYSAPSAATKFSSAAGRTFVAPDQDSLRAAATTLRPSPSKGVWTLHYSSLDSKAHAAAYPGLMVVYAAIPTSGISRTDAKNFGELLTFAARRGQRPGTAQGDLPKGYLPMTSANGLGDLAGYTARAGVAVAAQRGVLPSLVGGSTLGSTPGTSQSAGSGSSAGGSTSGGSFGGAGGVAGSVSGGGTIAQGGGNPSEPAGRRATSGSRQPARTGASSAPSSVAAQNPAFKTPRLDSALSGAVLPVILAVALVAAAVGGALRLRAGGRRS